MTTWYLCKHNDNYEMIQSDTVEDLEWRADGGKESVVDTYTTHLDLVRTKNTVYGDQCTERCCETFLTDFEVVTHIEHHLNAKALWDCVTDSETFYDETEDTDYRSGDVSTHHFFFGSIEGMKCDDCDDYPRRDEGDELDDEALHEAFDALLDATNDEVDVAGITLSPSHVLKECDETAYKTGFSDWLAGEVGDGVYVERDGRYFERV
jgi:hypothetical protein